MPEPGIDGSELDPTPERVAVLVESLAAVMRQSDVTELDVELGSVSVRLRRPAREPDRSELPNQIENDAAIGDSIADSHVITAPMIGTFYASPTPGAQPFIGEGDAVFVGQTIGIIEAMKIMNEIAADRSGTVEEILVGNGQPVEYGSPLLQLSLARGDRP